MQTTDGFDGLRCLDCGERFEEADASRCPDCDGALEATYDSEALADAHERLLDGVARGVSAFAAVLPFPAAAIPTVEEGGTPAVDCPTLAEEAGAERVVVKDEARNPTGGITDREMAVAVAAAAGSGADAVALPTTGNAGQSAAAYAARAGLESTSFVPSRANFANKAMINVHGGEMNVVGGRYGDAAGAFENASEDENWYPLDAFGTPYRHEGAKTLAYELVADLGGAPDAVVHPVGHGTGFFGLFRGFRELESTGAIEELPRLYAAQPDGCAPVVTARDADADETSAVDQPDTIAGPLEVPDPAGGRYVLAAIEESDGGAVAVEDKELLEAAVSLAQEGVGASATGGAAVAGVEALADAFDPDETVVVVNPASANREADLLRSHLMSKGI
jgi:threonine synthase